MRNKEAFNAKNQHPLSTMEGWKFTVALALFLAVFTVDASPLISGATTCEQIPCKNTDYERFPDPSNPCAYCCCSDGDEFAKTEKCHKDGLFNVHTGVCEGEHMCECSDAKCDDECLNGWMDYPVKNPGKICGFCICPKNGSMPYPGTCPCGRFEPGMMECVPDRQCPCNCKDILCREVLHGQPEVRLPNPNDRCGFCCCRDDLTNAIPLDCPFHERYDNVTNDCVPDPTHECPGPGPTFPGPSPTRTTPGGGSGGGGGDGGCETVSCPVDPDTAPLYACPNDPHSFCQCDWGQVAHTMPCGPGTTFNQKMQACL